MGRYNGGEYEGDREEGGRSNEEEGGIASYVYSNKLMNEIKPYMDHILSDQAVNSQEVQRGLQQLRDIHERMVEDVEGGKRGRGRGEEMIGGNLDGYGMAEFGERQEREGSEQRGEGDTNYLL